MNKPKLNIVFHNPNSNDEIVKLIIKIIAQQKVEELLNKKTHIYIPQSQI